MYSDSKLPLRVGRMRVFGGVVIADLSQLGSPKLRKIPMESGIYTVFAKMLSSARGVFITDVYLTSRNTIPKFNRHLHSLDIALPTGFLMIVDYIAAMNSGDLEMDNAHHALRRSLVPVALTQIEETANRAIMDVGRMVVAEFGFSPNTYPLMYSKEVVGVSLQIPAARRQWRKTFLEPGS